jgi:hypothetical protein
VPLAFSTLGAPGADITEIARLARRHDVAGVELRARALQAGANQVLSTATPGEKIVRAAELLVGG